MPTFKYYALDNSGAKRKGYLEAENKTKAFRLLQDMQLYPTSLRQSGQPGRRSGVLPERVASLLPGKSVNLSESFYYLAIMLRSGSSLAESLNLIGRMAGTRGDVWLELRDRVEAGESFSSALDANPKLFPSIYIGMIRVAESVGKLGEVLERIAAYEEQKNKISSQLLTSMAYPSVILVVGLGAVYFLLTRVLPDIAGVFTDAQQTLPWQTQVLLAVSSTLQTLGPLVLIPVLALVLAVLTAYRRIRSFSDQVDRVLWRFPLKRKSSLARFSSLLGFQLEAGIPLVQALDSAKFAAGSVYFKEVVERLGVAVSEGTPLDKAMASEGIFPDIYVLTVAAGQKAGSLGLFLQRLSRLLERELENTLKRAMALVEPLLILGIGLVIAFVVLAIMDPIFELTTLVR